MCRLWSCLTVALVVVVLHGVPLTAGDFGLPYTVPGFDGNFRSEIASGVVAVVKANASLSKYEPEADRSGATAVLQAVANNLTTPLNQLLGHVAASFGANGTEALRALADEIGALAAPSTAALEVALAASRTLEGKIRAALVETLTANVTTIATEVATLTHNWPLFVAPLLAAGAPEAAVTAELTQSVSSPVRLMNAALADIASAFGAVARERTAAIGHEAASRASVRSTRQDLENQLGTVNRSLADAARLAEQQCNTTVRQIRDGHSGILSRLASSASDVALVRAFLAEVEAQGVRHNGRMGELWRNLSASHARTVLSSADGIAARLVAATEALTDGASRDDGAYAERCLQRQVAELRQAPYAVTRLSGCYQADGRAPSYFTTAHSSFLDQLRHGALYAASQTQSVCGQGSPRCTATYLDALDGVGKLNQARLDAFDAFVAQEMGALAERYAICARAIAADVDRLIATNAQKFTTCLASGR